MAKSNANQSSAFHLNFPELERVFCKVCPDYNEEEDFSSPSVSRRFAERVLFEFNKMEKIAKSNKKDESYVLHLEFTEGKKIIKNTVVISTFLYSEPPTEQPKLEKNYLYLTFKQASLLAVAKYCDIVPDLVARNQIILTPLAGAVFGKESVPKIADALSDHYGRDVSVDTVIKAIICSCQTNGYFLKHSCCHIAVVALKKTLKDLEKRNSLIKKTIKMYKKYGKEFNMEMFMIYEKYANEHININAILKSKPVETETNDNEDISSFVAKVLNINEEDQPTSSKCSNMKFTIRSGTDIGKIKHKSGLPNKKINSSDSSGEEL